MNPLAPPGLLEALQKGFPLTARPWVALGLKLDLSEEQVLRAIDGLRQEGVLRQISAIFDSRSLGYQSVLVAAEVPEARLDEASAVISAHSGVSHNYQREHEFNLWFTLALAPGLSLEAEVSRLAQAAGFQRTRLLPALRTFKIEVNLDTAQGPSLARSQAAPRRERLVAHLDEFDREAVRQLQRDLPAIPRPFEPAARALAVSEERLFDWMLSAHERGFLRRFAGILRHRKAGFMANGMGVWRVDETRIEELGSKLASFQAVSHCYQRPHFPDWPYSLFSMVHGRDRAEVDQLFRGMSQEMGVPDYQVLYSSREFKKERVQYFLEAVHG